ncbi:UNVERIFIED_CONTAM: hypothetical protein Sradi_6618900 [Sesamum radiatum]|uniref:Uncharacterized protein n=1 Tax=Sesamum radiatum TaxID=300843 RepID=A0AAW2K164_SESRA
MCKVKEANKLLKTLPHGDRKKKVEGVPVFSAQNLDIAIATKDGIKCLTTEVVEEMGESMWDPPEVQEMLDEMGNPGIPLSIVSKAAEIQLLSAASFLRAQNPSRLISNSEFGEVAEVQKPGTLETVEKIILMIEGMDVEFPVPFWGLA